MQEIEEHSLRKESLFQASNMEWQKDITPALREQLIEWLFQANFNILNLSHETVHLSLKILDHYCYKRTFIGNIKMYLALGVTTLLIAAKYQEVKVIKFSDFVQIGGGQYTKSDILTN